MAQQQTGFLYDPHRGYFSRPGAEVTVFDDFYPAGHQSGITLILHGRRLAANGDVRFEATPGQWQPTPKQGERKVDAAKGAVSVSLSYPDASGHLRGFNPMLYPDFAFSYQVRAEADGDGVAVTVDIDRPVPPEYLGKLRFDLELFPGAMMGKGWLMDGESGVFPTQPNGPVRREPSNYPHTAGLPAPAGGADRERLAGFGKGYNPIVADDWIAEPYARGSRFTACPEDAHTCFTVESLGGPMELFDGRMNHNNGWFVLSSPIPAGATRGAVRWRIVPKTDPAWRYGPVVQVSQVGYHPKAPKVAVVELDPHDPGDAPAFLERISEAGTERVMDLSPERWGNFLRYRYLRLDFTSVTAPGLYRVAYGEARSALFRINEDVHDRGVWQPVLEYFLPVQMCHMLVREKYRVWHGACHLDDARMAPVGLNHIDGYVQGPSTLTRYQSGEHVPGLDRGGWHDAGDFDLRIESQAGEVYILSLIYEEFQLYWDATAVDEERRVVEIHEPDGKNDLQEQIEHGLLSILGGYRALGRLYRGVICGDLRQYVLLGDSAAMTDGVPSADDRWVFTEENPQRELTAAAELAAAARAMRGFHDAMSAEALAVSQELWRVTAEQGAEKEKFHCAAELFLTTGEEEYRAYLLENTALLRKEPRRLGWIACRAAGKLSDPAYTEALREALAPLAEEIDRESGETPYGIPYRPHIWGAGWDIQRQGFEYYFLHRAFPELFPKERLYHALNFILGCHPGENTASFASGVGTRSATVAYGLNRADWSFIPGGVISGTALIRPDLPELLEFPFLWQQTEYVLGGGSSHYLFLVLAAQKLLGRDAPTKEA